MFADDLVTIGKLYTKLSERKRSIWVAKCADIKTIDAQKLVVLLWVHHIITVHLEKSASANDSKTKAKPNIHCSFQIFLNI